MTRRKKQRALSALRCRFHNTRFQSRRRINEIVHGKRAITADTDLRLARYFNMSEAFFIGLQTDYELMERKRAIGDKLKAIRPRAA